MKHKVKKSHGRENADNMTQRYVIVEGFCRFLQNLASKKTIQRTKPDLFFWPEINILQTKIKDDILELR